MQLVTFSIDKDMNLVIQFPVFIQPYTEKPLILYQMETVPFPILVTLPSSLFTKVSNAGQDFKV